MNDWLNSQEAAKYLRVTRPALFSMTWRGQIPYYKLGNRNRYKLSELKELIKKPKNH